METLACIIQVGPMYLQRSFSKEEKGSQERECLGLMQCEKTWPVIAGYKKKEVAMSQEIWAALKSQERQGIRFSPRAARKESSPGDNLILAHWDLS